MRPPADRDRLERFLRALGREIREPLRLYLVGGASIVDLGLRTATLDVDYVAQADDPRGLLHLERVLPRLKDELDINVEPASPGDFMPVPAGALSQSRYLRNYGTVAVYHYYYPAQVLAKIARGSERDLADVELLLRAGVVHWAEVEQAWAEIAERDTGWLRHTPAQVAARLAATRRRLAAAGIIAAPTSP